MMVLTDRIAASGDGNPSTCCGGFSFAFFEPRWCSYQCAGGLSISNFLAEVRGDLGGFVTRSLRDETLGASAWEASLLVVSLVLGQTNSTISIIVENNLFTERMFYGNQTSFNTIHPSESFNPFNP